MNVSPKGRLARLSVVCLLLLVSGLSHAQSTPENEYKKLIRVSDQIHPLGDNAFGENVSLYNGSFSLSQTDVSLAGTGPLLQLTRSYDVTNVQEWLSYQDSAFGDWELDIPRITTLVAVQRDGTAPWIVNEADPSAQHRCSSFRAPPNAVTAEGGVWRPDAWWMGYQLKVPGQGSQDLLGRAAENTLSPQIDGMSFPIVTRQNWMISCLPTTDGSAVGEAFLAIAPDGTRYTFNHLIYRWASDLQRPWTSEPLAPASAQSIGFTPMIAQYDNLQRKLAEMLVTRVEDRFGNTLTYHYDGANLTSIVASDGRQLVLSYVSGTPRVDTATVRAGDGTSHTWSYQYLTGTHPSLSRVVLPDATAWNFNLTGLEGKNLGVVGGGRCDITASVGTSTWSGSITHPSGLTGTFELKPAIRGRSYVPKECWVDATGDNLSHAVIPEVYYQFVLVGKTYAGAGLSSQDWSYAYSAPNASWSSDACASGNTCATTVWTDVSDPAGNGTRYTFSNRFDASEGQLLKTEYYQGAVGGSLLRSESNAYASPTAGPWPTTYGSNYLGRINTAIIEQSSPLIRRTLSQDGNTYTWEAEDLNAFTQVRQTKRCNTIVGQPAVQEHTSYLNDLPHWVLGLPLTTTTASATDCDLDGLTAPETVDENVYDLTDVTLSQRSHFGQLLMSYAFDTYGNLSSFTDGNNHTTHLGSYKRGIPQSIGYPDGTSQSLAVDDFGQIASITDQVGATTSYSYDPVGRLTRISYPGGDEQAWYPKTFTYAYDTRDDRGLTGGHWSRVTTTGNARTVTWFDAELRPVLSDTSVTSSTGSVSHTSTRTDYDWKGQTVFASYPVAGSPSLASITDGTTSTYDALGRLTRTQQTSELGTLTTSTAYLSGARVQVTDPKGNLTTTSYQVFDEPSYDAVIQLQAPTGLTQTIARDVYGNPLSITQGGSYGTGTVGVTKSLTYDAFHRLCRTTEPESGSEVMAYDSANNLAWSADGLDIASGCGQDQVASAGRTVRTYDAMNRLLKLTPPSGTQSTTYDYDALGNLTSAVSGISTWSATRNKRGMLTGETLQLTGQSAWHIGYAHDAYGSLATLTYPDGETVSYAPDTLGRASQVGSYLHGLAYFPDGEVASYTYGNGTSYAAQKNDRQLLSNFTFGKGTTLNVSEDYAYDADGNLTKVTDLAGGPRTKAFGYDALNRLTSATASSLWGTESYAYDPLNNIRKRVGNGQTFTYNYETGTNHLTSISGAGSSSFRYDNRGNEIAKNGATLDFDQKNQLISITGQDTYSYDAAGRRVMKASSSGAPVYTFYNQGGQLLYQLDTAAATTTNFIYLGRKLVARDVTPSSTGPSPDGAPTLSVPASNSTSMYTVSWTAVSGSTSYLLQEQYNGSAWTTIQDTSALSDAVSGKHTGTYSYRVQACNAGGCGAWSTTKSVTVLLLPYPPATITVPATSSGAIAVSWTARGVATSYTLQQSFAGGSWTTVYQGPDLSFADTVTVAGDYVYRVNACDASGCSDYTTSSTVTVAISQIPAPTLNVPSNSSTSDYTVSWSAVSGATHYVLQEQYNGGTWATLQDTSALSDALTGRHAGTYSYRVQSCSASGCGVWSATRSVTVLLLPYAPATITVPASSVGDVAITWTGRPVATSYNLQQSFNGGAWTTIYQGPGLSFTQTVTDSGTYTYRVNACNASGCSDYTVSTGVAVTVPPGWAPYLIVPATSSTGDYTISWYSVIGATRYALQEQTNGGSWHTYGREPGDDFVQSMAFSGKEDGTYGYRIQACNAGGCGPVGIIKSIMVQRPPTAPANITVPAISSGDIAVSWTASAAATSYTLQQSLNAGTWATIYQGSNTGATQTVAVSGTYTYRVSACGAGGCSEYTTSSDVEVTIPPASAPDLSVSTGSSTGSYTVNWSAVSGATQYQLEEQANGGAWGTEDTTALSKAFSGRGDGTYGYRVRACNVGGCGPWSATVTVTVRLASPGALTLFVDTPTSSDGSYTLTWSGGRGADYDILLEQVGGGPWTTLLKGIAGSKTVSGKPDGTYNYKIQACSVLACGPWSATVTVIVGNVLAPPDNIQVSTSGPDYRTIVSISWDAVPAASTYNLEMTRNGTVSIAYSGAETSGGARINANDDVKFRLNSCNASGCSAWTDYFSTSLLAPPPTRLPR